MAPERLKSSWISFMLMCCPLGITVGFSITALFTNHYKWEGAFWVFSALSFLCSFLICLVPAKYFDVNHAIEYKKICMEKAILRVDEGQEQNQESARSKISDEI